MFLTILTHSYLARKNKKIEGAKRKIALAPVFVRKRNFEALRENGTKKSGNKSLLIITKASFLLDFPLFSL